MLVPWPSHPTDSISRPIRLAICGATGSIGRSALEIVRSNPESFEVFALTAQRNVEEIHKLCKEFNPRYSGVVSSDAAQALRALGLPSGTELCYGEAEIAAIAGHPDVDIVLAAVVGVAGLRSVESALKAGKTIALANKESLVAAGHLVSKLQQQTKATVLPVDSEHSAIFQVLQGQEKASVESLILTASGGPFLQRPLSALDKITPEEAVRHPRWNMGAKISVDSATMMNKALEIIEAHWLFGFTGKNIEVLVHPQSIIHSLIRLIDGSLIAQLSIPDMKGPIAYALNYPRERLPNVMTPLDLASLGLLEFAKLDDRRFPAVGLARRALDHGGSAGLVLNVANEVAVEAFLNRKMPFSGIVPFVAEALGEATGPAPQNFDELYREIAETRKRLSFALSRGNG